jgi:hypothetical protein
MHADPRVSSVTDDDHIWPPVLPVKKPPEDGRREVAQHGTRPTRLHGGEESATDRDVRVAHGVHPLVERVEPTLADPPGHGVLVEPTRRKFVHVDHTELRRRELGYPLVAPSGI